MKFKICGSETRIFDSARILNKCDVEYFKRSNKRTDMTRILFVSIRLEENVKIA